MKRKSATIRCAVWAVAVSCVAVAVESPQPAFSFKYGDRVVTGGESMQVDAHLKVTVESVAYPQFDAVEWVLWFVTLPRSNAGGMQKDAAAAYGKAAVDNGGAAPERLNLPFVAHFEVRLPSQKTFMKIGRGVDSGNIAPSGEYKFYDMGRVTLTPDCFVRFNGWGLQATLNGAYVEGEFNKARIYASLKFQGPAFYPSETNAQNQVWCDRVVVVRE